MLVESVHWMGKVTIFLLTLKYRAATIQSHALKNEVAVKINQFIGGLRILKSEPIIQDLLQELKYRMPNQLLKYTDKLEEGDLVKYKERPKVKEFTSKK